MKNDTNKNISVYYSGGSAGCFFALTIALATQKTHRISSTATPQEIIKKNWQINDYKDWDDSQVLYDFSFTKHSTKFPKYFGTGNIIKYDDVTRVFDDNSIRTLIYTDAETHQALMKLKHRAFYHNNFPSKMKALMMERYNIIKGKDWPEINQIKDCENLPNWIQESLINDFDFIYPFNDATQWIEQQKHSLTFHRNGIDIIKRTNEAIFDKVDHRFLLQDVIKTKFKCVSDTLGLDYNQEVIDHVNLWVSLHPKNIQEMFYKDI